MATSSKGLNLGHLVTMAFGCLVGVGWVVMLGQWLKQAGPMGSLIAFFCGALIICLVVLCYAELSAMFPVTGGEMIYAYEGFGPATSFWVGWLLVLIYVGVVAFEAISMGWLLSQIVPGIEGPAVYSFLGVPVKLGTTVLGVIYVGVLTAINYIGAREAGTMQNLLIYMKIALAAVFLTAGLIFGSSENLRPLFVATVAGGSPWPGILAVLMTAPFWYSGFGVVTQAQGELGSSTTVKSAGVAMMVAVIAAFVFYALLIVAASMATPRDTLLAADLPAAVAFESVLGSPILSKLVLTAGLLGQLTTGNAVFYAATRLLFSLSRAGFLPDAMARLHPQRKTPVLAIVIVGVVGAIATLAGKGAITPIVNLSGAVFALIYVVIAGIVISLRLRKPGLNRPYKIRGGLVVPILAGLCSLGLFVLAVVELNNGSKDHIPPEFSVSLAWIAVGLAAQAALRKQRPTGEAQRQRLLAGFSEP